MSDTNPTIVTYNNNYLMYNNYPILCKDNQYYCINLLEIQKIMSGNIGNSNDYLKKIYTKYINFNDNNNTIVIQKYVISKEYDINLSVKNIIDEPNNIFCNNKLKEINIDIVNYGKTITNENILKFYNSLDDDNKKKYIISKYINILTNNVLNKMEGLQKISDETKIIKEDIKKNIKELINYKDFFIPIDNNTECNNWDDNQKIGLGLFIASLIIGISIAIFGSKHLNIKYYISFILLFIGLFIVGLLLFLKVI